MNEDTITAEEKIKKYEALLQELLNAKVKKEGKILAGPDGGYFKITVGSDDQFVTVPKDKSFKHLKKGDHVIIMDGAIVERVPESLIIPEEEEVTFTKIGWESIGGMKSQIESIRKKVEYPVKYASIYKEFKLPLPKGILLHGPTGCGKTLIARAIASSMFGGKKVGSSSFIYLKGGELLSKYVGEAENRIKNLFTSARKSQHVTGIRTIIFIDEAEAILPTRGSRVSSDVDATIVPTFLSEMDGFEGNAPFVLLATNFEDRIDDAVLRPGRIDLRVYIGRPTQEDCEEIFKIHLSRTKVLGDVHKLCSEASHQLFETEKLQNEISGALIEGLVLSAIEIAICRKIEDRNTISGVIKADIMRAIKSR
jgi:SpoVK/Ycf46/Vps4 family AAA+-type ATPase